VVSYRQVGVEARAFYESRPFEESVAGEQQYDLIVIGAGSGGLAASKRAASYGAKVAVVEQDRVGGTCVIRGCVPKKMMVYAGELAHAFVDAPGYGFEVLAPALDWRRLAERRDAAVANLERRHEEFLSKAGVTLLRGHAVVTGRGEVSVDGHHYGARHVLIAAGAAPVFPRIEGVENAITSDGFFELREQPRRVVVVGGGYIAVELASILNALGTRVVLVLRGDLPLRGFDEDLRRELRDALIGAGIEVLTGSNVTKIEKRSEATRAYIATSDGERSIDVDHVVLYATGRDPRTAGLGLENVGVRLGARGEVITNDDGETSTPGVLAVGDVTGRAALTPVAIQAGRLLADRVFGGEDAHMSYDLIATAVFSDPPIGTVGLTEQQAIAKLGSERVRVFKAGFTPLFHTLTDRKTRTLVKLVVERDTDRVLGCHILGRDAAEIIQGFAVALEAGATKADFDRTIGIHPSSAEEFVTLT
jgi:glutathione reductase (NADPH)